MLLSFHLQPVHHVLLEFSLPCPFVLAGCEWAHEDLVVGEGRGGMRIVDQGESGLPSEVLESLFMGRAVSEFLGLYNG